MGALVRLIDNIVLLMTEISKPLVCELTKTFDCPSPGILLTKLKHYGLGNAEPDLFQSLFCNHWQWISVRENGISSFE